MRLAGAGLALVAVLFVALFATSSAFADSAPLVASLDEGQASFWTGAFVSDSRVDDPSLCGVEGECFDYRIDVKAAHAKVLRAAIASFDDSNGWDVELLDPSGAVAATNSTYTLNGIAENYDAEMFVHNPKRGAWTFRVIAKNVHLGDFQARAAVDPVIGAPSPKVACTPTRSTTVTIPARERRAHITSITVFLNGRRQKTLHGSRERVEVGLVGLSTGLAHVRLEIATLHGHFHVTKRITTCPAADTGTSSGVVDEPPDIAADAPWHLTFQQPPPMVVVEGGNYTALAGVHNPTMQVAGHAIYNCLPEETAQQGALRCLRFTSGFASLGPGPFEVYGSSTGPASPTGGPLFQVVSRSNGTTYSRPAGSYIFHQIHAHYHVLGIAEFRFYKVNSQDHSLTEAGKVLKEGFCLGNIKMYDWHSFSQDEIDPRSIDNCEPSLQPDGTWRFYEGITQGWEDSYKWQTSGQFVDVGNDPNGYYLLRVVVNPQHKLLETTYDDNTAYAYLQIDGNDVRVIERGHGESPWDPNKVVEDPVITR